MKNNIKIYGVKHTCIKYLSRYFSHPRHALAAWRRSKRQNACFLAFCVHQLLQFTPKSL